MPIWPEKLPDPIPWAAAAAHTWDRQSIGLGEVFQSGDFPWWWNEMRNFVIALQIQRAIYVTRHLAGHLSISNFSKCFGIPLTKSSWGSHFIQPPRPFRLSPKISTPRYFPKSLMLSHMTECLNSLHHPAQAGSTQGLALQPISFSSSRFLFLRLKSRWLFLELPGEKVNPNESFLVFMNRIYLTLQQPWSNFCGFLHSDVSLTFNISGWKKKKSFSMRMWPSVFGFFLGFSLLSCLAVSTLLCPTGQALCNKHK